MPVLLTIIFLIALWFFLGRNPPQESPEQVEHDLLSRCLGDKAQAERLIGNEMRRSPRISRHKAARRAIKSLARDQ
ncbi:MAG: hypothetical protein AB8G16_01615 [Gammaproteobacteria bacterium]